MTKTPVNDTGFPAELQVTHMLIRISYSCQLLLPIDEGNKFLASYSKAREWKEEYQKPTHILPGPPELTVRYISQKELAKMKFDEMLGLDDDA